MYKWKDDTQDTNLSWYVPKANVDHTFSGQGTAVSNLDHSVTTPKANNFWYGGYMCHIWIFDRNSAV